MKDGALAVVRIDGHVHELERRRKAVNAQRVFGDDALLIEEPRRLFLRPMLREARSRDEDDEDGREADDRKERAQKPSKRSPKPKWAPSGIRRKCGLADSGHG